MKIAIIRESKVKNLNPKVAEREPLSATETCFIHLACELSTYHTVKIFCPCQEQATYKGKGLVEYIPLAPTRSGIGTDRHVSLLLSQFKPDVVIVVGNPRYLMSPFLREYEKIFWHQNHPLELDKYKDFLLKAGHDNAFTVVLPSKESMEYAKNYYGNFSIKGIYNGVRDVFFKQSAVKKQKNKIVYVGPLSPAKGALELLKAAHDLKEYEFNICGSFDMYGYEVPGYREACNLYKGSHIKYLGGLGPEDLAHQIASAELCVVNPIIGNLETCCVSAMEAMATGTRVLAGGNSLIVPIIEHGGWTYTGDLKEAIYDMMTNHFKISSGREWVKNFTYDKIVSEWNKLLNKTKHLNITQ